MVILNFLMIYMFFSGMIIFSLKFNHLLMMLLGLEFVVLSIFLSMFNLYSFINYDYFFVLVYLVMSVSEGALSLGLLVSLIRSHGSDHILSFSFLW